MLFHKSQKVCLLPRCLPGQLFRCANLTSSREIDYFATLALAMWNNPVEQNLFLRSKEDHYDHYTAVHCLATAHGTTKVHLENFAEHDNAQLCTAVHTGNTRSKTIPDMAFFSRPCPCTCNTSLVSFISKNLQKEKGRCFEK